MNHLAGDVGCGHDDDDRSFTDDASKDYDSASEARAHMIASAAHRIDACSGDVSDLDGDVTAVDAEFEVEEFGSRCLTIDGLSEKLFFELSRAATGGLQLGYAMLRFGLAGGCYLRAELRRRGQRYRIVVGLQSRRQCR